MHYILRQLNGEVPSNRPGESVFGSGCADHCSDKRYCVGRLDLKSNDRTGCHERKQGGKEITAVVFSIEGSRKCAVHTKHPHVRDRETFLFDTRNDQTDETATYAVWFYHQ